jgi:DNA-binding HxlR family transcriptional regulator
MARSRRYGQFCPVAKAAEIVAERWTPLVLRELMCGSQRFNDLRRGLPLMSPSLLSQRLRELESAGILERQRSGTGKGWTYHLTEAGRELRPVVETLGRWGHRWVAQELARDDLDPSLLMWDVHRRIDLSAVPVTRAVVRFELTGAKRGMRRWWLVMDGARGEVDVCLKDPGFEVDLSVSSSLRTMVDVWLGYTPVRQAVTRGEVTLEGRRDLVRTFPKWIGCSVFAEAAG